MTYAELAEKILREMTPEQRASTVTMRDQDDEFFAAVLKVSDSNTDVLDTDHPYFDCDPDSRN